MNAYLIIEVKTGIVRYVFSNEYMAESLQRQIEVIEGIDCFIKECDEHTLDDQTKNMIDSCFWYIAPQ